MTPQPDLVGAKRLFVRLGKDSKPDIETIDALSKSPIEPIEIEVVCKQVPPEAASGSLVFVCLGSDNNKGAETTWTRGLRAIGVLVSKVGGPGYNDDWTVKISIGVVLPKSLSPREFVLEAPGLYPYFIDMPIIGAGANAQQTVQVVVAGRYEALLASLASIFPIVKHDLHRVYPELAEMASFVPAATTEPAKAPDHLDAGGGRLWRLLMTRRNVVLYGPPGTGKTHAALEMAATWRAVFGADSVMSTTFHPSYSYEMFVEGFRPLADDPDGHFYLQDGVLKVACERARALPQDAMMLLIIDEINRADVARVFGELITYIEPSKRGESFTLSQRPSTSYSIPSNLCFLGTMNTADKSVSLLDVALRRRFAFVDTPPDPSAFAAIPGWLETIGGIALSDLLVGLNQRLDSIGVPADRSLGHALIHVDDSATNPIASLLERLELDVFPLVEEYCYFDRTRVRDVLGSLVDDSGRWRRDLSENDQLKELRLMASGWVRLQVKLVQTGPEIHDSDLDDV